MLPALAFTGFHNVGKTTLVRRVVSLLRERGYRVGVVKSTKHRDLFPEPPGKDTALYRGDGLELVALMEPERAVLFWEGGPPLEELIFRLLGGWDLVVCEGFKESSLPKIEVVARAPDLERVLEEREHLLAVVWREPVEGMRTFSPQEPEALADFIEETFLKGEWAALRINGRSVYMKPFVERVVVNTLMGLVGSLKGGEEAEKVELLLRVPRNKG